MVTGKEAADVNAANGLLSAAYEKIDAVSCVDSSCISNGANLYGARATGATPGTKSIWNSTCHVDGSPGKSSRKTSEKSRTINTSSSRYSSSSSSDLFVGFVYIRNAYNLLIAYNHRMVVCQPVHANDNVKTA
ncbi:hypothetical protein Tco_0726642 [Tanacetum coccineum]|uniref:Uncharacterized protein n=1 Tax=Tanacetum coccineum TaxID=301880 RepID=A0ABQ4YH40_9ASTR